uniref:Uncharacterized protein n=1 Tax=Daphnia galeata TaxID=27404 RepID=A0A8J2RS76_9CRUS|nr:unnamed protein product [Daphnia galeata]
MLVLRNCKNAQECDERNREAKFALRSTDLENWNNSNCAAVVIHFPEGEQTYLFQVAKDEKTGHLKAYHARYVDYEEFEKAIYFGTAVTCPRELLEKAKQVKSKGTEYNPIDKQLPNMDESIFD